MGVQKDSTLLKEGRGMKSFTLRGGGGESAKCSGPAIFPFCSTPYLPVINYQSLKHILFVIYLPEICQ